MSAPDAPLDTLLGGRVRLDQAAAGQRASIEAVLLAAAVPARSGEAVLEAGTGVGTAALCLLARVPGLSVVGVESDPAQAAAAAENAALNGWTERFVALAGDIAQPATARAAARHGPYDHAMANPPWFGTGTAPRSAARRAARQADEAGLSPWVRFLARRVRPGGSVTLVLPAFLLPEALAAFRTERLGAGVLFPLWPRAGVAAKRVILAARIARRSPLAIAPGLVLHGSGGRFTAEAEAVLRGGEPIRIG